MNIKSATNSSVNVLEPKDQPNNPTPFIKNPTLQQKLLENKLIADSDRQEWIIGSGISEAITQLNLNSISDKEEIAQLLNWNYYGGTAGWYVQSIDLLTGQLRRFGQFKPNVALTFPNSAKPLKYLTFPKGDGTEVILLIPDFETWSKIADRYGVPIEPEDIDENRLDLGFWLWVAKNPQLPIELTEGAKKAGCLLTQGYISICLTGVWNGKEKQKLRAIPTLAPFLTNGRPIHLVFDADIVVKHQVQEALKYAGYLAQKQGCIVGVATWELAEDNKGVDDLIVNHGLATFEEVMDNLIPYKQWLKSLERQVSNSCIQAKTLDTKNLLEYVSNKYRDRLKLNELKQRIELDGVEYTLDRAYLTLAKHDSINAPKAKAADVFREVATENAFNPVKNYLEVVAKTASPISLDNLSSRYFGTSNPLYDAFLKRTLIAAVARTYEPGCKHDLALVLQGEQGIRKSTFFSVLGGEWFDDSMSDGRNKDDLIILHKCWIQEWGEIERVFGKRQAGELKAFITRKKDTFRQPYGLTALECPRRSIIVGSVNDSQFLVDPTGNRRYCVIPISVKRIDIQQLKQERDGIWAAAVKAYHQGEQWWLTDEEEKLSAANNQQFQIVDEWESAISHYLESRTQVSITEILTQVFDYELGKIDRSSQMRVGTILTNLGWKKVGRKQHQGKRQIVWQSGIPEKIAQGMPEVCQAETVVNQELDIPGIPDIPNNQVISKSEPNENQILSSKLEPSEVQGMAVGQSQSRQEIEPDTPADTPPQQAAIPWHDYPYNGNKQAKKQRANKVKERIFNCQTNNDLIKLLSSDRVSQREIDWLKTNVWTKAEIEHLESVENTRQFNLFNNESDRSHSAVSTQPIIEFDWNEVISSIDAQIKRIGWTVEIAQNYLQKTYGVKSRLHLKNAQILEFLEALRSQPTPGIM